ncbi:unnamed protein product, partial [Phaeothamnion confervicola]
VGLSNWALDPAKMNRCVHLFRPAPDTNDLVATAEGMAPSSVTLRGRLRRLAQAYAAVYARQRLRDFWGLREFYAIVKSIDAFLWASEQQRR